MSKCYIVPIVRTTCGYLRVEANNADDAADKAQAALDAGLDDADLLDPSCEDEVMRDEVAQEDNR